MFNNSRQAGAATLRDALQSAHIAICQCVQWISSQQMAGRLWFQHAALNQRWTKKFGEDYWGQRLIALLQDGQSLSRSAHAELLPVLQWFAGEAPVEWAGIRGAPSIHQAVLVMMEELAGRLKIAVYEARLDRMTDQEWEHLPSLDSTSLPLSAVATTEGFGAAMRVFRDLSPIDVRTTLLTLDHERFLAERRVAEPSAAGAQDVIRSSGRSAKRAGRPPKAESGKGRLVIGALVLHHQWQTGGVVGNSEPATTKRLAKLAQVDPATVSRFFKKKFTKGRLGYAGYVAACNQQATRNIGVLLLLWQGEAAEHLADLLPDESED